MPQPKHDAPPANWLTVAQLAVRLDLRESHVRALVRRDQLPVVRVGRLLRFHWPTVERSLLRSGDGSPS